MPHSARIPSASGFYHVVVKGAGGRPLFESDHQRNMFLRFLVDALKHAPIEIHAYCLMDNHVHLLVRDGGDGLSAFMKSLDEGYARYYAHASGRVGHVFQGRFWSEPIETESHYLCTLRYIHANPSVAGICHMARYPWSSFGAYLHGSPFVQTEFALSMLGGVRGFLDFSESLDCVARPFPSSRLRNHLAPNELVRIAVACLGGAPVYSVKAMDKKPRDNALNKMGDAGLSVAQISRLTGVGRTIVRLAVGQ